MTGDRKEELARNLAEVKAAIADACDSVGRDPAEITLIAVTKTWPVADIRLLHDLGVRDFGENRDQEAGPKAESLADLPLTWHFIGQLQTNKAARVAQYADVIHSVDRPKLVAALSAAAANRRLDCLVQVSLSGETGRGGALPAELPALADLVAAAPELRLAGCMAVAPLTAEPDEAFGRLAEIAADLRRRHPEAGIISAGMTHDFPAAIRHGATHLRIGSALLGNR